MKKILFAAIAATVMMPSVADAQSKYYMRERIVGLKTGGPVYTATYGAFGACSAGSQSAAIASCKDAGGATVANTLCSPQVKTQDCTMPVGQCTSFADHKWVNYTSGQWGSTDITAASNAELLTQAATYCKNFAQAGFCQVSYANATSGAAGNVRYYKTASARIETEGNNGYHFHSASCTAQ